MKNIVFMLMTMLFVIALSVAHAYGGAREPKNCVTDFTGRTYDSLPVLGPEVFHGAVQASEMEGIATGGIIGGPVNELKNCATDFSGRTYDTLPILGPEVSAAMQSMEMQGVATGGIIGGPAKERQNGVTDFSGRTYDEAPF